MQAKRVYRIYPPTQCLFPIRLGITKEISDFRTANLKTAKFILSVAESPDFLLPIISFGMAKFLPKILLF